MSDPSNILPKLSAAEEQVYHCLSSPTISVDIPSVIVISDVGKDYDDMVALLVLKELHRLGVICLKSMVANLMPAVRRAKMARRIFDLLGLEDVPVGIGQRASNKDYPENAYEFGWEQDAIDAMKDEDFRSGEELLRQSYVDAQRDGKKITVVLLSSLTDIDSFVASNEELFAHSTACVQIQGYNEFINGKLVPHQISPAANNMFDLPAAERFHALIQRLNIPSTTFTKNIAYVLPLSNDIFRQLAATGTSIGIHLEWLHFQITKQFYADSLTDLFKVDQTPEVILKMRTTWFDSHSPSDPLPKPEDLRPYLKKPILYDAIAVLGVMGEEVLQRLSNVGDKDWGVSPPFQADMRAGIHGEVGRVDEKSLHTFHPERMALILTALAKGALLYAEPSRIPDV
jgi:inosine-uridine nucleoside N-ribohydrolase